MNRTSDDLCRFCGKGKEISKHLLFECELFKHLPTGDTKQLEAKMEVILEKMCRTVGPIKAFEEKLKKIKKLESETPARPEPVVIVKQERNESEIIIVD